MFSTTYTKYDRVGRGKTPYHGAALGECTFRLERAVVFLETPMETTHFGVQIWFLTQKNRFLVKVD